MKLPLRARITAWYFAVLAVAFASFAWISDIGFQRSIETTVNDASRASLGSIQSVLVRTAPKGAQKVKEELNKLAGLWADAALLDVSDADGRTIFQSLPFKQAFPPLPPVAGSELTFFTTNLDHLQYRIAIRAVEADGRTFRVRALRPVSEIIKTGALQFLRRTMSCGVCQKRLTKCSTASKLP
jgi:hypothetical protein